MYNKISISRLFLFLFPTTYAIALILFFPVDGSIVDRANYLNYASYSSEIIFRHYSNGFLSLIFNEPIWLIMNVILGYFFSPESVIKTFIFLSSWTCCYLCLKHNKEHFLLVILIFLFPQVIKNHIIHLRQGVAISFFLIAYFRDNGFMKNLLFIVTPFIHLSFCFVLLIYGVCFLLKKTNFARDLSAFVIAAVGIGIAVSLKVIVTFLGSRQANEYEFTSASVSGAAFIFWAFFLALFWIQGRDFCRKYSFEILGLVFYLSTYFFLEVTARIFESYVLLVLLASCKLTSYKKVLFVFSLVAFLIFNYVSRLGLPYFGWGVI